MERDRTARSAVVLDRHPLWLDAVEDVLTRAGVATVGKTTSPATALSLIESTRPSIFITGIRMDDGHMDGIECVRQVRAAFPAVKVIVLSAYEDPEHVRLALAAGAMAYVVKTAHPDDLCSAIRQVFEHSIYLAGTRRQQAAEAAPSPEPTTGLTRREVEILRLVAEGLSNAELAKLLWVTEQTVKFHLSNIYRKLGVANRTEASRWAQLHGLLPGESARPRARETTAA